MNIPELLHQLSELGEQERIEAKTASQIGKSILETVCAFANEPGLGGGHLLLGVQLDEMMLFPTYQVVGIEDSDKIINDLTSQCRRAFNVPIRVGVTQEMVGDKVVIAVFVPEAEPQDKPVFFQGKGLPKGAFRRIGNSDQACTDDDLVVLYQGRLHETYDYRLVPDADLTDIDPEAVADYRRARADANPDAEELQWGDEDLLRSLGCLRNEKNAFRPTVAGILLFGTSQALRRLFPMMRVDYIRVPGKEWVSDPEKRFTSIDMRGPLISLIRRAQAAILDDLPSAFSLPENGLQREDKPIIPLRVIREAVVNAVMHRNYRVHSAIQIIRYANRLEIRNPGYSLVAPEHLGEPGSFPRNPKIAAVLHDTRFAEAKGSGILVMRRMMEEVGLTPPLFESDRTRDLFVARYLFHHFLGPEDWQWLARFKELDLSHEEARALIFVREVEAIDNAAYREINKVDTHNAGTHLKRLRSLGLLEAKGKGPATYYLPTQTLLEGASPEDLSGKSPELPEKSPELKHLPKELADRVQALGGWTSRDDFAQLIVDLCRWHILSAEQLARVTNRRQDYLLSRYLRPLIKANKLTYTIPEMPNHPQQAYQAAQPRKAGKTDHGASRHNEKAFE